MKELAPLDKVLASSKQKLPSMKYSIMDRDFFQEQFERRFLFMDTGKVFEALVHLAKQHNVIVDFCPVESNKGMLYGEGERVIIGIKMDMNLHEYVYSLAHELAHYFLHYDKGDTIASDRHIEYEEQADRAAKMLLDTLAVRQKGGAA